MKVMSKKRKKELFAVCLKKMRRYLYYEKKAIPKLSMKTNDVIDAFFKDQGIVRKYGRIEYIIALYLSNTNSVLSYRAIRKDKTNHPVNKYHNYLQSPEWRRKREDLFIAVGRVCEDCEDDLTIKEAHVHHLTYDNIFNESISDLQVLCPSCHKKKHRQQVRS